MPTKATIKSLTELSERVIAYGATYSVERKKELFYDSLLLPLLDYVHGPAKRQIKLKKRPGDKRNRRIDFEMRGPGRTVAEMACRTHHHSLQPGQNNSELQKLARQKAAVTRFLILLDPSRWPPLDRDTLIRQYRGFSLGPGRFTRLPVRILYIRPGHSFHFLWYAKSR